MKKVETPRSRPLISCDTFVCLPPSTTNNCVIFGKNSDRPEDEVQEIVFQEKRVHGEGAGALLHCTYLQIPQAEETFAVILSKPCWMWGAEMGANEHGVCVGNEAVWTKLNDGGIDLEKRLLGMDFVRLALERSVSALSAVHHITTLLEEHGQGGPCSNSSGMQSWTYHNSFLVADRKEAWVLETAGHLWAAERIESGWRNISNSLSIRTKIDLEREGLREEAARLGLWDGKEEFDFAKVFSEEDSSSSGRYYEGRKLLKGYSKDGHFDGASMKRILRDKPSGICMGCDSSFVSTSSQVSILGASSLEDSHWFTGTPDPSISIFKPFFFVGDAIRARAQYRQQLTPDVSMCRGGAPISYTHLLYEEHEKFRNLGGCGLGKEMLRLEKEIEERTAETVNKVFKNDKNKETEDDDDAMVKLGNAFNQAVANELEFYRKYLHF